MGDARQETLTKYLGDMKSVVSHVRTAMERQKDELKDQPDVAQAIARIALTLGRQEEDLAARLATLGGSPTHPVKEAVSDAFGVIAGLYNKVRTEGGAKALRDDHVALNLVYLSYSMLHTTAVALSDPGTADLAGRALREIARAVVEVDRLVPPVVLRELSDGDRGTLDTAAPEATRALIAAAWPRTEATQPQSGVIA
jgi:hypothetical protein